MKLNPIILLCLGLMPTSQALSIELLGHARSKAPISVVSEVSGVIQGQALEPGEKINKNQVLANIKPLTFKNDVEQKRAELQLAEANMRLKRSTYQRYKTLKSKNSLAANELDLAKSEYSSASASVTLARLQLEKAELDFANTEIKSGISGYISSRSVQTGAWVNPGDELYQIANIDVLRVRLLASEFDINQLKVGQEIELWAETRPNKRVLSKIKRIGIEVTSDSLSYPVEVEIENPGHTLLPGMAIHATTELSSEPSN